MGWTPLHTSAFHGQVVRCRNACMCRAACLRAPAAFRLPASTSCCSPRPMSTARSYISQPYSKPSWRYQILEEKHGCTPLMFAASSPKWVPQLVERPRSSEERSKNTVLLQSSTLRARMKSWTDHRFMSWPPRKCSVSDGLYLIWYDASKTGCLNLIILESTWEDAEAVLGGPCVQEGSRATTQSAPGVSDFSSIRALRTKRER